jgi:hypothetical protein
MATNDVKIRLTADDKTRGAFASANANLKNLQAGATRLGAAFGGLGAALSVGGLALFAKSGIDAADALNDVSQKLGVSVKDLASFKLAAEQSGTSLEGVGNGIARLTRSIGEAEGGNKKLAQALVALGVTARDPKEALFQLADATKRIEDPARRAALLSQVLGKSYQDLVPLLAQGSDELRNSATASASFAESMAKLAPDADKFNDQLAQLKINAAGAAAGILTQVVPSLNEYLGALQKVVQEGTTLEKAGFFALGFIPARILDEQATSVEDLGVRISSYRQRIAELAADGKDASAEIATMNKLLEKQAGIINKPPKRPGAGTVDTSAATSKATKSKGPDPQGAFVAKLKQEADTLGMGSEALRRYEATKLKLTGTNAKLADGYIAQIEAFKDLAAASQINNETFDAYLKKQDEADAVLENSIKSLREWLAAQEFEASLLGMTNVERETAIRLRDAEAAGIDTQTEAFARLRAQVQAANESARVGSMIEGADFSRLKQDQEDMILLSKAFTVGIADADGNLRKLSEAEYLDAVTNRLGLLADQAQELDTFAKKAAENIQQSMADFLFDPFDEGINGMLESFGKMLQRMIADAAAAQIARQLFGGLSDGGTTGGSGWVGGALELFGGLLASANGNAFANGAGLSAYSGTIVSSPTVFPFANGAGLMGEAGPEVILPLKRGSNGKLGVESGGGGSTIVVNVNGSNNAPDVRRAAAQGAREAMGMMSAAKRYA